MSMTKSCASLRADAERLPHLYRAHGLTISLPFACNDLSPADAEAVPDVVVREGDIPDSLSDARVSTAMHDASPDAYLLRGGPAAGRFLARNGDSILFERGSECDETRFQHILLHPMMAALLRQRDLFVLHASGVVGPGGVVLICGDSGAGKSTTAAALTRLGLPLQTDDVSALRLDEKGGIEVPAGAGHVHLFEAASHALAFDTQGLTQNAWHRMKMAVPALEERERGDARLRPIVHLERGPVPTVQVDRITGRAKLPLLLNSVFGPYLIEAIAPRAMLVARALQNVEMLRITRPDGEWTMDAVVAAILAD